MNYLLLHQNHELPLISALEISYRRWRERETTRNEENRAAGVICVYSQMHLIFEMPLAAIRDAEKVSIKHGMLSPQHGEYYFLLTSNYQKDLPALLQKEGFEDLAHALLSAPTVQLPELHTFIDSQNYEYQIIGWDREDAQCRLESDPRIDLPVTWSSSWLAFPSRSPVCLGRASEPYIEAEQPLEQTPVEEAVAESSTDDEIDPDIPF